MSNATRKLVVEILGDAKGMTKASKEAEAGIAGLEAKLGNVGSALTGAFAGGALAAFAKQSINAALEDQRAQERLAQTLKNVAQANREQVDAVEKSIASMESQFAVADDELRPAFETLVRATKDVGSAQSLMKLALDVSAGSGKSLQDVAVALVKAQNGQMKSLRDLGIAVKTTSGDTASFADVQAQLNAMFSGQAAQAANSQTGQMKKLGIQYENLKESVGSALLPVFMQLASVLSSLLGWWNHLDAGTQGFISRLVVFGGVALGAVKMFGLLKAAMVSFTETTTLSMGPLGLLVAAVSVLSMVLGKHESSTKSDTSAITTWTAAIEAQNAGTRDAIRLAAIQAVSGKEYTKLADAMGISTNDLADFVTGKTVPAFERLTKKQYEAIFANKDAMKSLEKLRKGYLDAVDAEKAKTNALEKDKQATDRTTESVRSFADVMQAAADATEAQKKASDELVKSLDDQRSKTMALANAELGLLDDKRNLAEAQKEYNDAIKSGDADKIQKASEGLARAFLAVADSAGTVAAEGLGPLATEAQKAAKKNEVMLQNLVALEQTLAPGSALRNNVDEWIAQLAKIPKSIVTTLSILGGQTTDNVARSWLGVAGHAQGGGVGANRPILVGERGPEIFMPGTSGRIIPNGGIGGGGGNTIQVNVTAPTGQDPYTWGQAIAKALKAFERVNGPIYAAAR